MRVPERYQYGSRITGIPYVGRHLTHERPILPCLDVLIPLPRIVVRVIGVLAKVAVGYIRREVTAAIPRFAPQLYVVIVAELNLVAALETVVLRYQYGTGGSLAVAGLAPGNHTAAVKTGVGHIPITYTRARVGYRYRQLAIRHHTTRIVHLIPLATVDRTPGEVIEELPRRLTITLRTGIGIAIVDVEIRAPFQYLVELHPYRGIYTTDVLLHPVVHPLPATYLYEPYVRKIILTVTIQIYIAPVALTYPLMNYQPHLVVGKIAAFTAGSCVPRLVIVPFRWVSGRRRRGSGR